MFELSYVLEFEQKLSNDISLCVNNQNLINHVERVSSSKT